MGFSARALANTFVALCLGAAILVTGASTFFAAQFSQVRSTLEGETETARLAADALDRIRTRLGPGGFLFRFGEFARQARPEDLAAMRSSLAGAESALQEFESLPQRSPEVALTQELRSLLAVYTDTVRASEILRNPPGPDFASSRGMALASAWATLNSTITSWQEDMAAARVDRLSRASQNSQITAVGGALSLLLMAICAAWLVRGRIVGPLNEMENSVFSMATGDTQTPVWGIHRRDEIGALARSMDRVRAQVAAAPPQMAGQGHDVEVAVARFEALAGRYEPLLGKAVAMVNQAADTLKNRTEIVEQLVRTTRTELTSSVTEVGDACSSVAQTSDDTQKVLLAAVEVMIEVMERLKSSGTQASARLDEVALRLQDQAASLGKHTTTLGKVGTSLEEEVMELVQGISGLMKGLTASENRIREAALEMGETAHTATEAGQKLGQAVAHVPDALSVAARQMRQQGDPADALPDDIRLRLNESLALLAGRIQAILNQLGDMRMAQIRAGQPVPDPAAALTGQSVSAPHPLKPAHWPAVSPG